jgi:hypothetical protein
MWAATAYVAAHPGCTKRDVSRHVSPESDKFGYAIVDRAIVAGLIEGERDGGTYALHVTAAGREVLDADSDRR